MSDQDQWSTNANEALDISFVQAGPDSPKTLTTFHPQFTYPIFGEEESIFGYQGLRIHLRFAAHDLFPNFEISYDKKFKAVGDTKATDLLETLSPWTPSESFERTGAFNTRIQSDTTGKDFRPPGDLLESYTSSNGRKFEIWSGELSDPAVRLLVGRMQILISFFIEGGTPLELDDQDWTLARWKVFFVYETLSKDVAPSASPYSLVGYSTSYRFITYTPSTPPPTPPTFTLPPTSPIAPTALPARERISQFLILPPHHSHGHGTHLYNAMVKTFLSSATCTEITVEDPNESFDDLRDYCDYTRLLADDTLPQITLRTTLDPKLSQKRIGVRVPTGQLLDLPLLDRLRRTTKTAPRQFARLVEMHLLSQIAPHSRQAGTTRLTQRARASNPHDRAFFYWRLLVKQRVYKKNRDVLVQLERAERVDKVEQTVGEVVGDYERLLRNLEMRKGGGRERVRGKRKVVDDEEEEDGEENGDREVVMGREKKRARSEVL